MSENRTLNKPNLHETLALNCHAVIEASAGTGKTYTIENLIYRILTDRLDGRFCERNYIGIESILAVTFTEKAASELSSRVHQLLKQRLAELQQPSQLNTEQLALRRHIENCLFNFDKASIFTIHGFCNRILQTYPFECSQVFYTTLVDDKQILIEQHLHDMRHEWKKIFKDKLQYTLELIQKYLKINPCSSDIISSIAVCYNPMAGDKIIPSTPFDIQQYETESAQLQSQMEQIEKSINALAAQLVQLGESVITKLRSSSANTANYHDYINLVCSLYEASRLCIDKNEIRPLENFFKRKTLSFASKMPKRGFVPWETLNLVNCCADRIHTLIEERKLIGQRLDTLSKNYALSAMATLVRQLYKNAVSKKRITNSISYGDMISLVLRCIKAADSPLCSILRQRYRYCIIDEFQDTSPEQWEIFRNIFIESPTHGTPPPPGNFLFVVGDPKQAIFSFQGSDVNTYLKARDEIRHHGGKVETLKKNYRSSSKMIEALNCIFSLSHWFDPHGEPTIFFEAAEIGNDASDTSVHFRCSNDKKTRFAPVMLCDFSQLNSVAEKRREAACWIAQTIGQMVLSDSSIEIFDETEKKFRPLAYSDIAVLVHKHSEAEIVGRLLALNGIPFSRYNHEGLFQSNEAFQLLVLLEAIENPSDEGKIKKALLSHYFEIPPNQIESIWIQPNYAQMKAIFDHWNWLSLHKQWGRLFDQIYSQTGLQFRMLLEPESQRRIANYRQLSEWAVAFLTNRAVGLEGLCRTMRNLYYNRITAAEDENILEKESEKSAVRLMTIHSSKGLQFPVVFIASGCGTENTSLPCIEIRRKDGGKDIYLDTKNKQLRNMMMLQRDGELRRLYYVALTRARYLLFVPIFDSVSCEPGDELKKENKSASKKFLSWCLMNALKICNNPELISYQRWLQIPQSVSAEKASLSELGVEATPQIILTEIEKQTISSPSLYATEICAPLRTLFQTSYTSLAHRSNNQPLSLEGRTDKEESVVKQQPSYFVATNEMLPGGAEVGTMFHQIMEKMPFRLAADAATPLALLENNVACNVIDEAMKRNRIDLNFRKQVCEIVWNSLNSLIDDPSEHGQKIRLAELDEVCTEVEFHLSYTAGNDPSGTFRRRGYVLGYIDLLFRRKKRYYILDWKSDILDNYNKATIDLAMEERFYNLQMMIYCVAVNRWLKTIIPDYTVEHNFGGIIYAFIRGMKAGSSEAVFCIRPSSETLFKYYTETIGRTIQEVLSPKQVNYYTISLKQDR